MKNFKDDHQRWEEQRVQPVIKRFPERKAKFLTSSGLELKRLYTIDDLPQPDEHDSLFPAEYPYTRGVYPTMYRGRLWTM
ncbi:MAG: methylmalonyl-CoA mutase family protein, partial [Chloroflexota bacterium]